MLVPTLLAYIALRGAPDALAWLGFLVDAHFAGASLLDDGLSTATCIVVIGVVSKTVRGSIILYSFASENVILLFGKRTGESWIRCEPHGVRLGCPYCHATPSGVLRHRRRPFLIGRCVTVVECSIDTES
ncbi:hypothetical protein MRX96_057502 [Rhipicephalus microplus]